MAATSDPHRTSDDAIRRVRAGDVEAFRDVIAAHEAQLRLVVGAIVPARAPVDDLVQEAFISAYLRLGEYRLGTDLGAWLRTLARNLALNERRRLERRRRLDRVLAEELESRFTERIDDFTAAFGGETERLRQCLAALGETPRRVVERFYFQARSTRDIAAEEKRGESWVHVVLFRARAALARCLGAGGDAAHG